MGASRAVSRPAEPLSLARAWPTSLPIWVIALAVGVAALVPRVAGLADFYTLDEAYHWPVRTRSFLAALRDGHWAGTNVTGHPGVTTMWLGSLGRLAALQLGVQPPGYGDGASFLAFLRFPLALVNSLAVVAGYALLRRLVSPATALLAALLWAVSPFLIAHSRLLHLDALLTSFLTLSLLLMTVAGAAAVSRVANNSEGGGSRQSSGLPWLFASGLFGGLALLTKGPSLIFLPIAGLLLLLWSPPLPLWRRLLWAAGRGLLWLACAALVVFVGWPAMWTSPVQAIGAVVNEILANGGQPHHSGNYFRGRPSADPGWVFYPTVVLWRSAPWTLLGLFLLPLALRRPRPAGRLVAGLACFALLFGVAMSLGPKKFDRYLLPIWPSLEILAAVGLVAAGHWVEALLGKGGRSFVAVRPVLRAAAVAALAIPIITTNIRFHPYYLAYFNPLLGGGPAARRVLLVGWGEGMEQIGVWLSRRPDLNAGPVLSWTPPVLVPFVPTQVHDLDDMTVQQPSSYAVLYIRSVQRGEAPGAEAYVRKTPPLYTLRIHDIDYATVHQLPRPFAEPVDALFGEALHLRGFTEEWRDGALTVTPSWNLQASRPAGISFFVHVLAADGARLAQADVPIDDAMFDTWQAGQQFGRPVSLPLPEPLPAGDYRVVLGVYDPATGERLPLSQVEALPPEIDGPHAVELMTFTPPR